MPNSEPTLLLIEDNPDDAALARRALTSTKTTARLQVAENVQSGLDLLQSQTALPKAVFVDLNMPERNGFDFLRLVRENPATEMLPVVVLTTSNSPADIERCYRLGANSFVTKPLDFGEFIDVFSTMSRYWLRFNQLPV